MKVYYLKKSRTSYDMEYEVFIAWNNENAVANIKKGFRALW